MFGKIFTQIFDSSLADSPQTRWIFMDLLVLADQNGVVDMTREAISRRTNVPLDIVTKAVSELEKPDKRSRSNEFAGARIKRLDDHRDWGWVIVNYTKYRAIANSSMYREVTRDKVRKIRSDSAQDTSSKDGYVYYMADGDEVKIGHSLNPWSRLSEIKTARPKAQIVATEPGDKQLEKLRHEIFKELRKEGEWFIFSDLIKNFIRSNRSVITNPKCTAYASAFASAFASGNEGVQGEQPPLFEVTTKKFQKPDMASMELYAAKIGLPVTEINKFYDYYEANGWKVGRNPMKSWEAAMRNWKNNMQTYGTKKTVTNRPETNKRNQGVIDNGTDYAAAGRAKLARQHSGMARQVALPESPSSGDIAPGA